MEGRLAAMNFTVSVYGEFIEWFYKVAVFQTPMSRDPLSSLYSYFWTLLNMYTTLSCVEMWLNCGLFDTISYLMCFFFLSLNFEANVANLNLFRFAGRPGKYNKLFSRWRLEEVSAMRHQYKWVIIAAIAGLITDLSFSVYLDFWGNNFLSEPLILHITGIFTFNDQEPKLGGGCPMISSWLSII